MKKHYFNIVCCIIAFVSCFKKDNSIAVGWELVGAGDKAAGDERA